jgi:hypothetical protein
VTERPRVTPLTDGTYGTIFLQLWHVRKIAHSSLLPNGQAPVGATEQRAEGSSVFAHRLGYRPAETPRPLSTDEAPAMACTFAKAAANGRCGRRDVPDVSVRFSYGIMRIWTPQ